MGKLIVIAAGMVVVFSQANAAFAMSTNARVGECIRRCYVSLPHNPDMCIVDCIMTDGTHNPRITEEQPFGIKPEVFGDTEVGPSPSPQLRLHD